MIRLLQWLFIGHVHKWKTVEDRTFETRGAKGEIVTKGKRYIQQCDLCGVVVKRDMA